MRTSIRLCGAALIAAGLMAAGAPAFADSSHNNGLGLLDDNDISILPIQNCGYIGVLDDLIPIHLLDSQQANGSPHVTDCTNAPISHGLYRG